MAFAQSQLHVSRPLTDLVVSYDPSTDGHIRSFLFPRKPVDKMINQIRQVSKADLLRAYDLKAGGEGRVAEVQFRMDSTLSYNATPFAVQAVISQLEALNADEELQYEQRQTMQAMASMGVQLEQLAINQTIRSASVMTSNQTVVAGNRWDNYTSSTSDPLSDLLAAVTQVNHKTGKKCNRLVMGEFVWRKLQRHPKSLTAVQYNPAGTGSILTLDVLANILDLEGGAKSIMVTSAGYTSSAQGEPGAYKTFLGSDVLVARVEDPSLSDFGLGHEFAFSGFSGDAFSVIKINDPLRGVLGADLIKVVSAVDYKVLNPDAGFLFKGVVDITNSIYLNYLD
jgi:hypothetical protein